jgi:hypothetical protein
MSRMRAVVHAAVLVSGLAYLIVGVFGYLTFLEETEGNIFNNYDDHILVGTLCCAPFPLHDNLTSTLHCRDWQDPLGRGHRVRSQSLSAALTRLNSTTNAWKSFCHHSKNSFSYPIIHYPARIAVDSIVLEVSPNKCAPIFFPPEPLWCTVLTVPTPPTSDRAGCRTSRFGTLSSPPA